MHVVSLEVLSRCAAIEKAVCMLSCITIVHIMGLFAALYFGITAATLLHRCSAACSISIVTLTPLWRSFG
jgi:hypothetical protein